MTQLTTKHYQNTLWGTYSIYSWKLSRVKNIDFVDCQSEMWAGLSYVLSAQKFAKETFAECSNTAKFAKFFTRKIFRLYSTSQSPPSSPLTVSFAELFSPALSSHSPSLSPPSLSGSAHCWLSGSRTELGGNHLATSVSPCTLHQSLLEEKS